MEKKTPQKIHALTALSASNAPIALHMCVPQHGKKKCPAKKTKVHRKPLFLKF